MINHAIKKLIAYGLSCRLVEAEDVVFIRNRLLELLHLDAYEEPAEEYADGELESILAELIDYARQKGMIDTLYHGDPDLFDTRIMGLLVPRPSAVIAEFWRRYRQDPAAATDYFYKLACDSDYIRRYRIKKDRRWQVDTEYGALDITINLSKPEKDPKAIAAALAAPPSGYPACALCRETEGYAGGPRAAARQNHRLIPLDLDGEPYFLQYSPYVYYNEHCIVLNEKHIPMKISGAVFDRLLDFVDRFPHYFIGSNADLPIVGGSILSHDHFQGGRYEFAMERAPVEREISFEGYADVYAGIVRWPMSVIRLRGREKGRLSALAGRILDRWRGYSDPDAFIFAYTGDTPHNTITPIARRRGEEYELDLVLRNNITTDEHPMGVYHPHAELHHIKKENIGLIEVMGLAVLPARLKTSLGAVAEGLFLGADLVNNPQTAPHAPWVESIARRFAPYVGKDRERIDAILREEVGRVFVRVLEDAGVFKRTPEGYAAFDRFLRGVS